MENKIDLDALEAALAKATPGTWHVGEGASGREVADLYAVAAGMNALPGLIAELRELRAESAAIKARAWQSIETAPKNGTGFLAWNESLRIVEASWWSGNMAGITHWQPFPDGPTHALPLPPALEVRRGEEVLDA
jgi:hypothetical protein